MKIAVPITASTMDEALRDIEKASLIADFIELRIDYLNKPDLEKLLGAAGKPKIVTNRVSYEGGRYQGSENERIGYLQKAIDLGAELVDIELNHFHELDRKSSKLIVSYHNFECTPKNLEEIYHQIVAKGADIVKIAAKAQSPEDSLRMLNLIESADKPIIGVSMGQYGIMTRVLGPVFGGYLTFASLGEGKASAPGQLTVEELRNIWKSMQFTS